MKGTGSDSPLVRMVEARAMEAGVKIEGADQQKKERPYVRRCVDCGNWRHKTCQVMNKKTSGKHRCGFKDLRNKRGSIK
jgi:hypothetical protein